MTGKHDRKTRQENTAGKHGMSDKAKTPINLSEFGRRIKAIRKDHLKLSQQKLAGSIDVSPSFISAIEAGITNQCIL